MHAIIKYNQTISRVLGYHDHKVRLGKAETIAAENFVKDRQHLTLPEAQYHFDRLSSRNQRVEKNVVHIFLRFDQHEQIENEKMAFVAGDYLEGMGFGEQPWLAYRHYDSLIPHAHLVTTNVREDGTKIRITLRDFYYSRELTHSLEESYGLNKSQRNTLLLADTGSSWEKVQYGEKALFPSMNRVLEEVIPNYTYTSLDELNAVLSLHNMRADRPALHKGSGGHGGLYYRALTEDGRPLRPGINASTFPSRPIMTDLEARFSANQSLREPLRSQLTTAIDWCLIGTPLSLGAFREAMGYEGISLVFRQGSNGDLENCWFIDHNSRTVFEGAALGENYSAKGLAARCIPEETYRQQQSEIQTETHRQHLHL